MRQHAKPIFSETLARGFCMSECGHKEYYYIKTQNIMNVSIAAIRLR
jgi:hypothetical protein